MSPSKSFGSMYQRKSSNSGSLTRNKSEHSMYSAVSNGDGATYGDGDQIRQLSGYIDEYIASGVIDDIIDLNCQDFKVWASVINDGFRDRKTAEIHHFINLILDLFEQNS
eukprot:TRINITY_DN5186_c0_g1_i1.p1 TRINITY_DN5186_c0_g1~~TRINITY_DN5186_c0_g1_i1.p1  ORF type:complete len:110 (-),score=29.21 TRINITY_DN5186_c0_g1_i1:43-372(-)